MSHSMTDTFIVCLSCLLNLPIVCALLKSAKLYSKRFYAILFTSIPIKPAKGCCKKVEFSTEKCIYKLLGWPTTLCT